MEEHRNASSGKPGQVVTVCVLCRLTLTPKTDCNSPRLDKRVAIRVKGQPYWCGHSCLGVTLAGASPEQLSHFRVRGCLVSVLLQSLCSSWPRALFSQGWGQRRQCRGGSQATPTAFLTTPRSLESRSVNVAVKSGRRPGRRVGVP